LLPFHLRSRPTIVLLKLSLKMSDEAYDSSHAHARRSRVWSGSKPLAFFILAIACAVGHHVVNTLLSGHPVESLDLAAANITIFEHTFYPLKKLGQKQKHWIFNLFAFLFKSCVIQAMQYGLSQHAWKVLRTNDLSVADIDRVVALQHRKPSGLWCWNLWCNSFDFVLYGIITILVPYVAIFPGGSLIVVQQNDVPVYAYNPNWLAYPYAGVLGVTFLCMAFGTKHLFSHNKTNLSFAFSHILSATRNTAFDDILKDANMHYVPAKVLEEFGQVKYGIIRGTRREGFALAKNLEDSTENEKDSEADGGCFGCCA